MQLKSRVNRILSCMYKYKYTATVFRPSMCYIANVQFTGGVLRDPIAIARLSYRKHKYHVHGISISFIFFQITGRNIQRKLTFNFSFILSFMQKCRTIKLSDYRYESECNTKFSIWHMHWWVFLDCRLKMAFSCWRSSIYSPKFSTEV